MRDLQRAQRAPLDRGVAQARGNDDAAGGRRRGDAGLHVRRERHAVRVELAMPERRLQRRVPALLVLLRALGEADHDVAPAQAVPEAPAQFSKRRRGRPRPRAPRIGHMQDVDDVTVPSLSGSLRSDDVQRSLRRPRVARAGAVQHRSGRLRQASSRQARDGARALRRRRSRGALGRAAGPRQPGGARAARQRRAARRPRRRRAAADARDRGRRSSAPGSSARCCCRCRSSTATRGSATA